MEAQVTRQVDQWAHDGVICPSPAGCQWNSPLIAVYKPHQCQGVPAAVRVCLDPRRVNALLVSGDNFPIPVVLDLLDRFAGGSVFSSLDLKAGYNQFTIREEDLCKLSFTWGGR